VADGVWSDSSSAITSAAGTVEVQAAPACPELHINKLNQTLGSIWREVDTAGVLASQESFGVLNAGCKPSKYQVGDYVYHYQPKTEPEGAPSKLLIPWVGPWRIEEMVRAKDARMRHIDAGVEIDRGSHLNHHSCPLWRKSLVTIVISMPWSSTCKMCRTGCHVTMS
jgi:hypothetical protein